MLITLVNAAIVAGATYLARSRPNTKIIETVKAPSDKSSVQLPIDSTAVGVESIFLLYRLRTTIKEVNKEPNDYSIIIDLAGSQNTKFIIDSETRKIASDGQEQDLNPSQDLQSGQKVVIRVRYDLKTKEWNVRTIQIL